MQTDTELNNIKNSIDDIVSKINAYKGQESLLEKQISDSENNIEKIIHERDVFKKAVEILGLIQRENNERIKVGFESIVTYALQYIYNDPNYGLKLEFKRRGNMTDLNFNTISPGFSEPYDPIMTEAGGFIDVIAVALRIALLSLNVSKNEGFVIFDESFKALSSDLMENAGNFLKAINKKIGRQIIFITHRKNLIKCADKIIKIGDVEEL